jgi:predicted RNase H-like nuclease (RuvC/YqgF family)
MGEQNQGQKPPENGAITQESYDQLKTELEAERTRNAELMDQATSPLKERITLLETEVTNKTADIEALKTQITEKEKSFSSLQAEVQTSLSAYRELMAKANPLVPADMITGKSIEEINTSVEKAAGYVNFIKDKLGQQSQNSQVPPGSPGRQEPDTSTMTSREKINYGLEKARKKS